MIKTYVIQSYFADEIGWSDEWDSPSLEDAEARFTWELENGDVGALRLIERTGRPVCNPRWSWNPTNPYRVLREQG